MTKLKKTNGDKTLKLKWWQNSKAQIVTKLKKTQIITKSATKLNVTILKNSNCDKTQNSICDKTENPNCDKTWIMTKLNLTIIKL